MNINRTLLIFLTFLKHDFYIYLKQIKNYLINYAIIYPALFSFSYGYIIPNTLFNQQTLPSISIVLAGSLALIILILCFALNIFFLLDLNGDKFIDYQIILLNPRLVVIEKITFSTLFSFILLLPFFFVSKILLRESLDTTNTSIPHLIAIIFLGCLTCSSYLFMSMCILKEPQKTGSWWRRFNSPMLTLGGSWIPWLSIYKLSALLGYLSLLNPILYITEGTRSSLIGGDIYISFYYCALALIAFSIIFTLLSLHFFKKRIDHI